MTRRSGWLAAAPTVTAALWAAASAHAAWSPADLVSASSAEQVAVAVARPSVDVSGDGRFAVFQSPARNLVQGEAPDGMVRFGGIFRKRLDGAGEVELVAPGLTVDPADPTRTLPPAVAPSVSASGRYVAFSTARALVAQDDNGASDVYVRDMDRPSTDPGAFTLVSALDGSSAPASYGAPEGSGVTPRLAISDDGRRVAFFSASASNLPDGSAQVDRGQGFVRDLDAKTTTIVTVARDGTPAGGLLPQRGLGISGDGGTVVWAGGTSGQILPQEEPVGFLWRRVADGPAAVTRLVAGSLDVDDPACDPATALSAACAGPFQPVDSGSSPVAGVQGPFGLSRDGRRVAFLSQVPLLGLPVTEPSAQAYVADMSAGLSQKQRVTELTRGSLIGDAARSAPVLSIALSGDGRRLAFTSQRIRFLLSVPSLLGPGAAVVGGVELYVVDLERKTMELATRAYDGTQSSTGNTDEGYPSMSDDGGVVAFSSEADNLVRGDANSATDAFIVRRLTEEAGALAPVTAGGDPPALVPLAGGLKVGATTRGRAIRVLVLAPGRGMLDMTAVVTGRNTAVGHVRVEVGDDGLAWATLRLPRALRSALARRVPPFRVRALFTGPGGATLRSSVRVRRTTAAAGGTLQ